MSARQDDVKANIQRREEMLSLITALDNRITNEKDALVAEDNGSGNARNPDITKRTKREVKADLDDSLLCLLKFEAEATECRTQAKILLKDFQRRP